MNADHPATAAHEIRGYLTYSDYGDSPYWQWGKVVAAFDGGRKDINLELDGERWVVSVGYQNGGLEPRPSDPIDGNLREYRVTAHGEEERKLPLLIQPRLDWDAERRPQSVPADLGLATNVKLEQCVNLEPAEIEDLIPRVLRLIAEKAGVDWHPNYFTGTPHEYSSVTQYERYLRVMREFGRKIVNSDGIFHRLFHLLADQEGSKIVFSADNRDVVGYNHQLQLPTRAVSDMFPDGTRHGMQLKHYHPEHVRKDEKTDDGETDPLYHPKLGALFKKGLNDESIRWHEIDDLTQELEETLVNVLEWADIPTKGSTSFISDWHFDANSRSEQDVALFEDPTPAVEASQESVLISTLTRLSDRDTDVLERVVRTDGGLHVGEIATETEWSTSTIYRALRKLDDLLENENGNVSFISAKIRDRVRELVSQLDETVEATTRIIEDTLRVDPRDLERQGRAWQNWLTRYGAELVRDGEQPSENAKIRLREILSVYKSDSYENIGEILEYGKISWIKAGRDPAVFENATVVFDDPEGTTVANKARLLISKYAPG
ncbi:Predicted transcriptional regulator [Natronorubrum sediminis]|uniref:Predicted transcriptional regulator n=1 Tax=Natronorubrum sediminis TaxID=640943 RepID=A0A1H6FV34_9EURY|nr:MarR family transcriptional regulator [Natronorubrum sediminis]SEH14637.1 Predicted transcriptional regulator [Natronorubrum sediminis]